MDRFSIGRRIEFYREKLGLSTQQLANRINRSQATISRIENGKQGLTPELLTYIARELRVHPFALLSDEPLRHSILLPISEQNVGEYAPNLLASAIRAGRVREKHRIQVAAHLLELPQNELEMMEMGLTQPDDALLEKICSLYGMDLNEMRALVKFSQDAPDLSRRLACMQHMVSKIGHIAKKSQPGTETAALAKIGDIIDNADSEHPMPSDGPAENENQSLSGFSARFANALKKKDFYDKLIELVKVHEDEEVPTGLAENTEMAGIRNG